MVGIKGRYPADPGPLKAANFHMQVFVWGDGRSTLRLEEQTCDDFWLEVTVRLNDVDELALARLADDGCPLGGDSGPSSTPPRSSRSATRWGSSVMSLRNAVRIAAGAFQPLHQSPVFRATIR